MYNSLTIKKFIKIIPESPGVYLMKDKKRKILYIGKAGNLKRRVTSYFLRPLEHRLQKMVSEIKKIDFKKADTSLEALILESRLIKKYKPPYNVREKDDKSFLYVEITKEKFPRVILLRGKDLKRGATYYGPFVEAKHLREALRIIRKIFPYSTHKETQIIAHKKTNIDADKTQTRINTDINAAPTVADQISDKPKSVANDQCELASSIQRKSGISENQRYNPRESARGCFNWQIGLCPGTCIGVINRQAYVKTIRNINLIFQGRKPALLRKLENEMNLAAGRQEYEYAEKIKKQIFAIKHIKDIALISDSESNMSSGGGQMLRKRIEGYDISNISGTYSVGSMVVFSAKGGSASGGINFQPQNSEYRKFKIRTITGSNDIGMLKEVLNRRLKHKEWPLPSLIFVDGGKGQVNAIKKILGDNSMNIPVFGIAKGPKRKKNEFIGNLYETKSRKDLFVDEKLLIRVRDEAHRFAISYHKKLRDKI